MSSGNTRKRTVQELLEIPFRSKKSRSSSPSPTSTAAPAAGNAPANTPGTTLLGNNICGDLSPSHQSTKVPVPMMNNAFLKAIQEHINTLSDEDKAAFQSATDVMEKLRKFQHAKSRISGSPAALTQKVQKALQCVKQFLAPVAICIQHHPEISSLVVGGLHCVLTVSPYPSSSVIGVQSLT